MSRAATGASANQINLIVFPRILRMLVAVVRGKPLPSQVCVRRDGALRYAGVRPPTRMAAAACFQAPFGGRGAALLCLAAPAGHRVTFFVQGIVLLWQVLAPLFLLRSVFCFAKRVWCARPPTRFFPRILWMLVVVGALRAFL